MGVCVVCPNQTGKHSKQSFHKFPFKRRPHVADKWVQWVRTLRNSSWTPNRESIICSDHFKASSFDRSTFRSELNINSVPTIIGPAVRGRKRESPLPETDTDSRLKNDSRNDRAPTPEFVDVSSAPEPTARSAPQVEASQKKSALNGIARTSTLKAHSGKNGTSTHNSSTSNVTELPATEVPNTPEKNLPAESNDECSIMPKSSTTSLPDNRCTGCQRSRFLHDHNYEDSPRTCRKKVVQLRKNLQKSRALNKAQDHKIKRLKKKLVSLKELVGTLRKECRICKDGLECPDSFADVSHEL